MTEPHTPGPLDYAEPRPRRLRFRTIVAGAGWVVLAAVLGVVCAGLAFMMGGLGHGWTAPGSVAWVALVTVPLTAVALLLRRRLAGKALALVLFVVALVSDVYLFSAIETEGWDYAAYRWERDRESMLAWTLLWGLWQLGALAALA